MVLMLLVLALMDVPLISTLNQLTVPDLLLDVAQIMHKSPTEIAQQVKALQPWGEMFREVLVASSSWKLMLVHHSHAVKQLF